MRKNKLDIGLRFLEEREKIEKTRSKFAESHGINESSMRGWEKGSEIPASILPQLEAAGLDIAYILTGDRSEPQTIDLPDISSADFREVPFYSDEIAAGQPIENRDHPEGIVVIHRDWCKDQNKMVAVRVSRTGSSMEPTIPAGAIVTIDISQTTPEALLGEVVAIFKADENGATIKRLARAGSGWCGMPDNRSPEYGVIVIEDGDRIIGKVSSVHYTL